jgi:sugar-phosphatase
MELGSYKKLLFDLDDTLVNSSEIVALSMRAWCKQNQVDFDLAIEKGKGCRTEDTVSSIAPHLNPIVEAKKIEIMERSLVSKIKPKEGAANLLNCLNKSQWAIVTSSISSVARSKLRASALPQPDLI